LDLGCGAGRDSGFLALRGWRVLAVDNMPKALARARTLAARCGVGSSDDSELRGSLATAVVDVRKDPGSLDRALRAAHLWGSSSSSDRSSSEGRGSDGSGAVCHLDVPTAVAAAAAASGASDNSARDGGRGAASAKRLRLGSAVLGAAAVEGGALGSFGCGVDLLVVSRFFYRPLLDSPPLKMTTAAAAEEVATPAERAATTAAAEKGGEEKEEEESVATTGAVAGSKTAPQAPAAPRALLLTARELVAPGGLVFWHHFRDGCQRHPLGHPSNDADIVRPGELLAAFQGWRVLLNDEAAFLPDGRPMVTFVAQRPLED
jgi:SAM-dependent methyltransferase